MRRLVLVALVACGGAQVPAHNGYKNDKPWKKAKVLKLDATGEAKDEGDLSYPDRRRAKWLAIDLPSFGQLDVALDITPPGDTAGDDYDVGLEVLDSGYRSLYLADADNGDNAHELAKKHSLVDRPPGRYYVHVFLEGRMDTADYTVHVAFKPTAAVEKSNFPAEVAALPALAQVPITDDAPASYKPPVPDKTPPPPHRTPPGGGGGGGHTPPPPPDKPKDPPPPAKTLSGRIVSVSVVSGGTRIIIGASTATGAQPRMHGALKGIGSFDVECNDKACVAQLSATPDQIKNAGDVVLTPISP